MKIAYLKTLRDDLLFMIGCVTVIALFLLPLLLGWGRMFFDDIAFDFYPQQVFLARCLGEGIIPWWDPHICAGATPFYTRFFQSSLYPINWLFLYLGHIFPTHNYLLLVKAPLALHFMFSAGLAFSFARWGLRINRVGALVFSLVYTLSPTMIYMATYPPEVFIQAWLPLFCLVIILFARTGRYRWLLLGAGSFALVSPGGDMPFVVRVVLITALFGTGWAILLLHRKQWRAALRVVLGGIAVFGVGALLSGFYWANMLGGLHLLEEFMARSIKGLSGINQSLPPLYLVTLFIPNFFGGVTSAHTWGAAYCIHCSLNDANLLGGLVAVFLVVLGVTTAVVTRRNNESFPSPRVIIWLFMVLFGISLFAVLGPYTPVYSVLRLMIPAFKMPYPLRFRDIQCFAMAGLMGTSAALIWEKRMSHRLRLVLVVLYFAFVFAAVLFSLLGSYRIDEGEVVRGYRHLGMLRDWGWFYRGPLLYFVLGGSVLLAGVLYLKRRGLAVLIMILALGESFTFAYLALFHNRILNRRLPEMTTYRFRNPDEHPVYRQVDEFHRATANGEEFYRRGYYRSTLDNLGWFFGSSSALGFNVKPLMGRFGEAVSPLAPGLPYELRPKDWRGWFWSNMSVRDILIVRPGSPAHTLGPYIRERLDYALPRFYFQDRWVVADNQRQQLSLVSCDLRDIGYYPEEVRAKLPESSQLPSPAPLPEKEWREKFSLLQRSNAVLDVDLSNPNRIGLEIVAARPAMLVITDIWHPGWTATDNDSPIPIHRVNYLQRGIWLEPGRHDLRLKFRPAALDTGRWLTASGLIIVLSMVIWRGVLGWRRKRKSGC